MLVRLTDELKTQAFEVAACEKLRELGENQCQSA